MAQKREAMNNLLSNLPIAIAIIISSGIFAFLIYKRPGMVTKIRVNLLWLSTLVAILTLVFGTRLIELLQSSSGNANANTNTVEIVLSSLVGVGIGGLIAIAGQLVQDSDQDSSNTRPPDNRNEDSNETR